MTGYTTDPGELRAAAALLTTVSDGVAAARLDPALSSRLGPGRLGAVAAAFTADSQDDLAATADTLAGGAELLTAAHRAYTDTDDEAAAAITRLGER
ncbi:hypothetical protein [Actinokineospora sp.]|uniref:hypothetical protein n=1 Tax=Actinokineospora sp. TaxID=1872133 RepID=UPI0040376241